ncbi:MAG: sugar phosphate nucleotidyltransferase, partial [Oscillospiraceae bacterium]|nr:sugar phosphate nucleotidyltransferase [Oscillospiraceae bacterium]
IMSVDSDNRVTAFEEKPEKPKSNLASMGIYVFKWATLRSYLEKDSDDPESSNDFGKNIIPAMLDAGEKMYAFRFDGYWKDVGTVDSLWEANMDLISPRVPFDLWTGDWKIYCRNPGKPPQYVGKNAVINNSIATAGSAIDGLVDSSVIFDGVTIEEGAVVRDSVIMPGSVVESGAVVQYAIVAENSVIKKGAKVGERPEHSDTKNNEWGIAVISSGISVGENAVVKPKAMIYESVPEGEVW